MLIDIKAAIEQRGKKTEGYLEVAKRFDGSVIGLPVIVVSGKTEGPVLVLDGCTHGDEHEGTEGIIRLVKDLDPKHLKGTVIAVPVVNVLAFEAGDRFAPSFYYGSDLNRAFPGKEDGRITQRIAHVHIQEIVSRADYVISFHGGTNRWSVLPGIVCQNTGNKELDSKSFDMARAFGTPVIWKGAAAFPGVLTDTTAKLGIPTAMPELGGQAMRGHQWEELVQICVRGTTNVMKALGMLQGDLEFVLDKMTVIEPPVYITNTKAGMFRANKQLGQMVKEGEVIGEIYDLFGKVVEKIKAPFDGLLYVIWSYPMVVTGNWVALVGKVIEDIEV
ncbi:MAG: succinylglutamate desuccinylase/aspartoacylase family protein [Bacteroidales bacterium]|nr:succinylglutamate desuccinylase/aspartoacylase family protein [Bacteroidales bacterium]